MTEPELHVVAGLGAVGRAVVDELAARGLPVRLAPWAVDHSKFERAFGARVTPHREAIRATLDWYATLS